VIGDGWTSRWDNRLSSLVVEWLSVRHPELVSGPPFCHPEFISGSAYLDAETSSA